MGIRIGDTPLDLRSQEDFAAQDAQNEASAVRGLRSGTYDTGSALSALVGNIAEVAGADKLSKRAYAKAKALGLRAQEEAPLINSLDDVHNVSTLGSFLTGRLGQMTPALAAGSLGVAATGGSGLLAELGGMTLANAPLEIGHTIMRQQADPEAQKQSAGARLGLASAVGTTSAAMQNAVPLAMGGKLLGRVGENVGAQSLKQILARNAGEAVAGNAAAGTGAELLQQGGMSALSPDRDKSGDTEALKAAALEGAVVGAPFGAMGVGGEVLHGKAGRINQGVRETAGSVKDRLTPGKRGPEEGAAPAGEIAPETPPGGPTPSMYSFDLFNKTHNPDADIARKMAADQETVDPSIATAGPAAQEAAFAASDKTRFDKAAQWAQDIINDPTARAELKQQVADMAGNFGDRANQVAIAGMKMAQDRTRDAVDAINLFADHAATKWKDLVETGKQRDPFLKNEQSTALDAGVVNSIAPLLQEHHPELLNNPDALSKLGESLRKTILAISSGKNDSFDKVASDHLANVFGGDVHKVFDTLFDHFSPTMKPEQRERVLSAINDLASTEEARKPLRDVVMSSIRPEMQDSITTSQARAATERINQYTRGELIDKNASAAEQQRAERLFKEQMTRYFGDKADAVLKAAEKANKPKDKGVLGVEDVKSGEGDANEHTLETQTAEERLAAPTYYGTGKKKDTPFLHESANMELFGNAGASKRLLDQARADHPGQYVEAIPAKQHAKETGMDEARLHELTGGEPDKYSMVKVHPEEKSDTKLTPAEINDMYLDAKHYGDSPSRIDTDGKRSLDAMGVVRTMLKKFKINDSYAESDDKGFLHVVARAFNEGLAGVIDHNGKDAGELFPKLSKDKAGKPVFDDSLVVWRGKDKTVTYGDIKGLEHSPVREEGAGEIGSGKTDTELQRALDKVQMRMQDITDKAMQTDKSDTRSLNEFREKWAELRRIERALESGQEGRASARRKHDFLQGDADGGIYTKSIAERNRYTENRGEPEGTAHSRTGGYFDRPEPSYYGASEYPADGQIHLAAMTNGEGKNLEIRKDVAGDTITYANSGRQKTGREALTTRFEAIKEAGTAPQKALANKALALLKKFDELPASAQKALTALTKEGKLSAVADTINGLYDRFGGEAKKSEAQFSKQATSAGPGMTPEQIKDVGNYIDKVLGKSVEKFITSNMGHSGEFFRTEGQDHLGKKVVRDVIRISTHAFDPMSVAAHESLHAFFEKLRDTGNHDVMQALYKAADSVQVMEQLRDLLKDDRKALKQVEDSMEERAAYMYQFWANGALNVNPKTKSIFTRIANMIKHALGIWTANERAQHVMEYFARGDYVADMHNRSAVAKALMEPGTNRAVNAFKRMTAPIIKMHNAVLSSGDARVRALNNPALTRLADLVHREHAAAGQDEGYIPAWTHKRLQVLNTFIERMGGVDESAMNGAIEALQQNLPGRTPAERKVIAAVRGTLDHMFEYMQRAGVDVKDLGVGKDYFPRNWDAEYIRKNEPAFRQMLDKYVQSGELNAKSVNGIIQSLLHDDGSEIPLSMKHVPAFSSGKERSLKFITPRDAAPFLQKDLIRTMNSYITQATRRAEYARRFGEDGGKLEHIFRTARERYGATPEDIALARKYLAGVDGTLGNDIDPGLNRLFGNMQVYQNIRLLPLAVFSSLIDPIRVVVRGGTLGDAFRTFKRGIMEIPRGFKENPKNDYWTDITESIGAIESKMLLHTIGSQASVGLGDTAAKLNNMFFKYNLMEQFNQSMRVGATEAAARFILKHNDGKASEHSERWMAELGLRPGDAKTDANGNLLITKQQFLDAGRTEAEATAGAAKMSTALNKWVDSAVLRPNEAHKAIWMNDPHWRLVAHLKQFVFAFQHAMIDRVLHEAQYGNYKPAAALAGFVPVMIASDMIKGLLVNGGQLPQYQQDWDAEDFVWNGVQRAGLLGVGQFRADMVRSLIHGGDGIGALSGPTIEQLTDGIHAIGRGDISKATIHALPANALYSHYLGEHGDGGPMFAD